MKLDSKQRVLVAIYIEYQKDIPEMEENIRTGKVGMDAETFNIAIDKLQSEELITGANIIKAGIGNKIQFVSTQDMKMTSKGIEYVEEKIGLSHVLTGQEKVKEILKSLASSGWKQIKDIAAKTLAEMNKN